MCLPYNDEITNKAANLSEIGEKHPDSFEIDLWEICNKNSLTTDKYITNIRNKSKIVAECHFFLHITFW